MISFNPNFSAQSFKALTIKPKESEWNREVLDAALDSRYVQDFVSNAAKNKEDVTMTFTKSEPDEYMPYSYKILNFKLKSVGQSMSIKSVARPEMTRNGVVFKDIYGKEEKDVEKDMAKQLRDFGVVDENSTHEEKITNLYKLAAFNK